MKYFLISTLTLFTLIGCDSDTNDNVSPENTGVWINEVETNALNQVEFLGTRGYDTNQACAFFRNGNSYQIQAVRVLGSGIIFPVIADRYGFVELSGEEDVLGRIEFDGIYTDYSIGQRDADGYTLTGALADFPDIGILVISKLYVGTFGDENEQNEIFTQTSFEELEEKNDMISVFCRD